MGILNSLTSSAEADYSLRKLLTAYSGSAIRVRESSGDTEADIGFDGSGNLDATALLAHTGSNSGYITIWYDQSGNGYDATQTTDASQPQIVSAGAVLVDDNGNPKVTFDGSNDFLQISSNLNCTPYITVNFVNKFNGFGTAAYMQFISKRNTSGARWQVNPRKNDGKYDLFLTAFGGTWDTNQNLLTFIWDNGNRYIYENKVLEYSVSIGGTVTSDTSIPVYIGCINGSSEFVDGDFQEIIFFNSAIGSTDRETLEADQDAYWINPVTGNTIQITNTVSTSVAIIKDIAKTFINNVSSAITSIKSIPRTILNNVSTSTVVNAIKKLLVTITNNVSANDSVIKKSSKIISNSVSLANTVLKSVAKKIINIVSSLTAIIATKIGGNSVNITNIVSAGTSITKNITKLITNIVGVTTSAIKSITKTIANIISTLTSSLKSIPRSISNNVSTSTIANVVKKMIVLITNTVSTASSIVKSISKIITNSVSSVTSYIRAISKSITNNVSSSTINSNDSIIEGAIKIIKAKVRNYIFKVRGR